MIVYGRNPVRELLRAGRRPVRRVWATASAARDLGLEAETATPDELARRAGSEAHQGICALTGEYPYADPAGLLAGEGLVVALDEVQDPQNLGAVCRTAEVAGALGVVIPERRSAEVTPAVCKASAGAVEHLALARVRNLADFLEEAKRSGFWSYGADAGAARSHLEIEWPERSVLVLGAEGRGLRKRVANVCDELVRVPMRGRLDSLNVSATAAVLIYAALQPHFRA